MTPAYSPDQPSFTSPSTQTRTRHLVSGLGEDQRRQRPRPNGRPWPASWRGWPVGDLRHDARACRQRAASELIRKGLGLDTPQEREARIRREQKEAQEARRLQQLGTPLGIEVEP